jgi:hypothetical protein
MMSSHNDSFTASGSSPTQRETFSTPPDFLVENHGSIFLLKPQTPSAISWVEEHIGQDNGYQTFWPTCVVEHRFIAAIVIGIQNDGLTVQS